MSHSQTSFQSPIPSSNRKRTLSSPEFLNELKKHCYKLCHSSPDTPLREPNMAHSGDNMETAPVGDVPLVSRKDDSGSNIVLGIGDIEAISKALETTFETKLSSMINTIVNSVLAGVQQNLDSLKAENSSLQAENKALKEQITGLKHSQDAAEQYSRRNNLRISGIPEKPGESIDGIVIKMAHSIEADITIDAIDRCHRVGKPMPGRNRDIIVKMVSYRYRQRLMNKRKFLRDCGYRKVFLNEDLTKDRSRLFFSARGLIKTGKITGAWTSDGTVLIKDNSSVVHRIIDESDLARFA